MTQLARYEVEVPARRIVSGSFNKVAFFRGKHPKDHSWRSYVLRCAKEPVKGHEDAEEVSLMSRLSRKQIHPELQCISPNRRCVIMAGKTSFSRTLEGLEAGYRGGDAIVFGLACRVLNHARLVKEVPILSYESAAGSQQELVALE